MTMLFKSSCVGLPILMSTPHFYQGSETYVNGVKGMDPNQTLHETFFVLEDVKRLFVSSLFTSVVMNNPSIIELDIVGYNGGLNTNSD